MTHQPCLVAAFPAKYIQGERAIEQLPGLISRLGTKALIIASRTASKILTENFPNIESISATVEEFRGECCEQELGRIEESIRSAGADVIIGMGGGKAIDSSKIAADRAGLPVIVFPTIASTDAPCSGCAVIYNDAGVFESVYYMKSNPQAVIVDSRIVAEAPVRFLIAGIGDALATWFEARDCQRARSMNECGGTSTISALSLARLCYDTIFSYGESAIIACQNQTVTPALERVIEANTLLSGIGFESSGLAAAHSIHNGLSAIPATHSYYHGEKVAFGVLTQLHLTDAAPQEIDEVYTFCESVGLPTTLAGIGIVNPSKNDLMDVAEKSCAPQESIHHEAGIITPLMVSEAIAMADAYGRARKK